MSSLSPMRTSHPRVVLSQLRRSVTSRTIVTSKACDLQYPSPYRIHRCGYVTPTNAKQNITSSLPSPVDLVAPNVHSPEFPLAILSTSVVLRTYMITAISSSPTLLKLTTALLQRMADSQSILFSADRNLFLHWILKKTFYAQFCSGEKRSEVQRSLARIRDTGYTGTMLEYALEVLCNKGQNVSKSQSTKDIGVWRKGMLESVGMVRSDDMVMLKWSGLGTEALQRLNSKKPPTPEMREAIMEVCDLAASKGVPLLPGAELACTNPGLDAWTLELQRKYNRRADGKAIMYTTYQTYLRAAPTWLARDLAAAQRGGFLLGVKLVRGAYLNSEPKDKVCASKAETDRQYDAMVEAVLRRKWNDVLQPQSGNPNEPFPEVALMIASHNAPSVKKAIAIRKDQAAAGEKRIECAYSQLQGMADDISCDLLSERHTASEPGTNVEERPRVFKCATWGTLNECLHFLLRRAAENQDAASRTADTRRVMGQELRRRTRSALGLV